MMTRGERIAWAGAAAALVLGAGALTWAIRGVYAVVPRLERKSGEVRKVLVLEQRVKKMQDAKEAYAAMAGKPVDPTAAILREVLAGHRVEEPRVMHREIPGGWVVRQEEISLNDVPVANAIEFVRRIERQKPPWRLARCSIRTSGDVPGVANVVLQVEAVEKKL
jgi:hypothetical protein